MAIWNALSLTLANMISSKFFYTLCSLRIFIRFLSLVGVWSVSGSWRAKVLDDELRASPLVLPVEERWWINIAVPWRATSYHNQNIKMMFIFHFEENFDHILVFLVGSLHEIFGSKWITLLCRVSKMILSLRRQHKLYWQWKHMSRDSA